MSDIKIDRQIPTDARGALDEALRAAIGDNYAGMDAGKYGVIVHLKIANTDHENTARQTVLAHDISARTADQMERAAKKNERQAARDAADTITLDESAFTGKQADLACMVKWLALEVKDLREKLGE
jgi:hypothetical protein